MRSGELFAGVGGLGMAVDAVFGSTPAWFAEVDPAPSRVLAHHHQDVPNLGDVTRINWDTIEPVDVLAGGFPCQDVSLAGRRRGMGEGTRSGLWAEFAKAIDTIRPDWVIIENVRGLTSADANSDVEPCPWCLGGGAEQHALRALGAVLGDLADLGFDAEWTGLRAADVGAPHGRFRVFILAWPSERTVADTGSGRGRGRAIAPGQGEGTGADAPADGADTRHDRAPETVTNIESQVLLLPTPGAYQPGGSQHPHKRRAGGHAINLQDVAEHVTDWGPYEGAIRNWETTLGRPAPAPVRMDGAGGKARLNPALTEWMMGWPTGHVTDPAIGLTRSEQLKACGNGVVPQQAEAALRELLSRPGVPAW